jgi:glutathione S-transferase
MGDIPLGIHVHRWLLYDIDRPEMTNLARWYDAVRQRPAFQRWVENPANHLAG